MHFKNAKPKYKDSIIVVKSCTDGCGSFGFEDYTMSSDIKQMRAEMSYLRRVLINQDAQSKDTTVKRGRWLTNTDETISYNLKDKMEYYQYIKASLKSPNISNKEKERLSAILNKLDNQEFLIGSRDL